MSADKKKIAKEVRNIIEDLESKGINSSTFKNEFGEYSKKDFETIIGETKSGALDRLKTDYKTRLSRLEKSSSAYSEIANDIKNTPLNKKTISEISRRNEKINSVKNRVGTVLGLAGSVALGVVTKSPKAAIGAAALTGSIGLWLGPETDEERIYDKKNK